MNVAFIGLGNIGRPMALCMLEKGCHLTVHDVRQEACTEALAMGALWAANPAEAVRAADVIVTSLPNPGTVESVVFGRNGIVEGIKRGAILAETSTCNAEVIGRIDETLKRKGARAIDTPVSGGPGPARKGELLVMVGGDAALLEQARPALGTFGGNITHIGPLGAGYTAKLVHNMVFYTIVTSVAEGLAVAGRAGISGEMMVQILSGGAVGRGAALHMAARIARGEMEPSSGFFALKAGLKDVMLGVRASNDLGAPAMLGGLVEQLFRIGMARGLGDREVGRMFEVMADLAGARTSERHP